MKYMGSKARYAKQLLLAIKENCNFSNYENWVEPFVGACGMITEVEGLTRWGNDINPHIIAMFKAIQRGWEPLDFYDETSYLAARTRSRIAVNLSLEESAEIGFIGIGCAYSGKWFGGYARSHSKNGATRNYTKESKTNLLRQKKFLQDVIFSTSSYEEMIIPRNSIIYCDPPYAHTIRYRGQKAFNTTKFWDYCEKWYSDGHLVLVSEYTAPKDWHCIWEKERTSSLTKDTGSKRAVEKLFVK